VLRDVEGTAIITGVVGAEVEFNLVRDPGGNGTLSGAGESVDPCLEWERAAGIPYPPGP